MVTTKSAHTRSHAWGAASQNIHQPPTLCLGPLLCTLRLGRYNQSCMNTLTATPWVRLAPARPTTPTNDSSLRKICTAGAPTSPPPTAGPSQVTSSPATTRRPRAGTSHRTRPARPRAVPASRIPPCASSPTTGALPSSACRPTYDSCLSLPNSDHLQRSRKKEQVLTLADGLQRTRQQTGCPRPELRTQFSPSEEGGKQPAQQPTAAK